MQSCSVHHCVLLLLTLTFTTAPVAAAVCRVQAKLHQRVTLTCDHECPGEAMWNMQSNRSVVFALCNQTSCSSVLKGYEMSHDQYLKGDLSLTITAAEYSMRNTYACECGDTDHAIWRLSIETVFSAVQVKHDGDLILDLSVPEPVEVIYTSSDSADGERICNVTQHSLQCKAEYTHRTSLRYPELTLRDVTYSDSGRYTIRDTENKEDIRVYSVAVTGLTKGMIAGIVVAVLVVVLVLGLWTIGVIILSCTQVKKLRAAKERRKVENEEQAVAGQMRQLLNLLHYENRRRKDQFNPYTKQMESILKNAEDLGSAMEELKKKLDEVEKEINDLEERYRENRRYKDRVGSFCSRRRGDLDMYRNLYKTIQTKSPESDPGPVYRLIGSRQLRKMMTMMEMVMGNLESLRCSESLKLQSSFYTQVDSGLNEIKYWCKNTRDDLKPFKEECGGDEVNVKLMIDDTEALLRELGKWREDKEEELQKYKPQPVSAEHSENQPPESEPLNHNV